MSMSSIDFEDGPVLDPDDLKMPENPRHRRAIELIALTAEARLGPGHTVYRDMNWYPRDGRTAVAPDIMILPADTLAPMDKSYRPDSADAPSPTMVVEVVSDSDTYSGIGAKVSRYLHLAVPCLVIDLAPDSTNLVLHRPHELPTPAIGTPIAELGDLQITFDGDDLVVTTRSGTRVSSTHQLLQLETARAERLAAQMRALGIEPEA